jgi:hypothetical protein
MARRFQAKSARAKIQSFLNSCARVVEQREQSMVTLALDCRSVRLRQDRGNLIRLQIADLALCRAFYRNTKHFHALSGSQWIPVNQESKEAPESGQAAVPRSDRNLAFHLGVF